MLQFCGVVPLWSQRRWGTRAARYGCGLSLVLVRRFLPSICAAAFVFVCVLLSARSKINATMGPSVVRHVTVEPQRNSASFPIARALDPSQNRLCCCMLEVRGDWRPRDVGGSPDCGPNLLAGRGRRGRIVALVASATLQDLSGFEPYSDCLLLNPDMREPLENLGVRVMGVISRADITQHLQHDAQTPDLADPHTHAPSRHRIFSSIRLGNSPFSPASPARGIALGLALLLAALGPSSPIAFSLFSSRGAPCTRSHPRPLLIAPPSWQITDPPRSPIAPALQRMAEARPTRIVVSCWRPPSELLLPRSTFADRRSHGLRLCMAAARRHLGQPIRGGGRRAGCGSRTHDGSSVCQCVWLGIQALG